MVIFVVQAAPNRARAMQLEGPNRPKIAHGQNRAKIAHGQNRPKIAQGLGSLLGWTKEAYVGYLGLVLTL